MRELREITFMGLLVFFYFKTRFHVRTDFPGKVTYRHCACTPNVVKFVDDLCLGPSFVFILLYSVYFSARPLNVCVYIYI